MRKSTNHGGEPIFVFKIEMPISKQIFAKAIAGHCHEGGEFNPKWSKKEVLSILKERLTYNGVQGIYTDHWDGASEEFLSDYQNGYNAAIEWIEKNYPYLSK